jgi:Lrp/AsnC family leucine-responsive transcriptional regulator
MAFETHEALDQTDWQLLAELQQNARITFSELGRRVSMSAPAVAERIRRLEDLGIIRGYRAKVDLEKLGWPLLAFIRVREKPSPRRSMDQVIADRPEVLECHHVTGDDCFILKVAARSMRDLEETARYLARFGSVTTSLVYSTPLDGRVMCGAGGSAEDGPVEGPSPGLLRPALVRPRRSVAGGRAVG